MSLCVPEWDRSGGMLDAVIPANDFLGPLKGKGEFVRGKRSNLSHLASVPDHDTEEVVWKEIEHVGMQSRPSKGSKSHWQPNYTSEWSNGHETEDGVPPSKPPAAKDCALEAVGNETPAEAPAVSNIHMQDDEMLIYLQYRLDDSLERNYCSDFFGDMPHSNMVKESFVGQGAGRAQRMPLPGSAGNDTGANRASCADAAMLLGAGRAAGVLPQAGVEVFNKVRTQSLPPSASKLQPHTPHSSKGFNLYPPASPAPSRASPAESGPLSTPMLPPKSQPVALTNSAPAHPHRNFSHFSTTAQRIKANLHSLKGRSPSPNERFKQQLPGKPLVEASTSTGSSIAESTTTGRSAMGSQRDADLHFASSDGQPQYVVGNSRWPAAPTPTSRKEVGCAEVEPMDCKAKPVDQDTCRLSSVTGSAVLSSEKAGSQGTQLPDVQEPTITSSSGGSGNSAERAKEAATSIKRKFRDAEDTDCHSEDGEDESVDLKKPLPGRGSTAKRSRAAEVHNQSERRRRDRINEKMKALQELIPNSNKTDKASMLDEAIEYLKMLQLQLQMMSMRSGMSLPPMVMPSGLQQPLQMPQMPAMPPMVGMVGMQMGLGIGMMDMGAAAPGRPVMPMPSHAGPSHNGNVSVPSMNMVDVHDPRLHTSSVMDSLAYLARQHQPLQMPQTIDMYSAYMLQRHQHQQHQHQHQHHHHHHQPPNMAGGPPQ